MTGKQEFATPTTYPFKAWYDGRGWNATFEADEKPCEISGYHSYAQLVDEVRDEVLKQLHRGEENAASDSVEV